MARTMGSSESGCVGSDYYHCCLVDEQQSDNDTLATNSTLLCQRKFFSMAKIGLFKQVLWWQQIRMDKECTARMLLLPTYEPA